MVYNVKNVAKSVELSCFEVFLAYVIQRIQDNLSPEEIKRLSYLWFTW